MSLTPRRTRLCATAVTALLLATTVRAQTEKLEPIDAGAQAFVSLFSSTCVKYYRAPDKLSEDLTGKGLPLVDPEHGSPFLHDVPGKAWSISDEHGEFVVALNDKGVCSVFARRAKDADVQLLFATLVQRIQVPDAVMTKVVDKQTDSQIGTTHYVAYAQQRKTPGPYASFGLTTTASEKAAIQALATLSTREQH
jgi:hypothetical protein